MLARSTAGTGTRPEGVPAAERVARRTLESFWASVGGITAVVAGFLLVQLHAWPPHEDETLVFFLSRQPFDDLMNTVLGERGGAPLHFLFAYAVTHLDAGLTGLRLVSVAFAVGSVPLIAALVARLADRRTALLATLLASASWVLLFHGIYARMYSLFLCTSVLSFLLLLRALEDGSRRRWTLWALAALAMLATQPYGALVLTAEGAYVLARCARRRFPLRTPLAAFVAVAVLATPLWLTYLHLASRFEVGFEGNGSKLGSPLDVLEYLWDTLGDFSAGWLFVSVPVGLLALSGLVVLARRRAAAALLAAAVILVPAVTLVATRSGTSLSLETRHLIFVLPFFAMLLAVGVLRLGRLAGRTAPLVVASATLALLVAQVVWGWTKTPWLYDREPGSRVEARHAAAEWLAREARPDDVLWGYEPLYLDAWEAGAPYGELFVPRADAGLALESLREAGEPLGRGVWVLDASDQLDRAKVKLEIPLRSPGGDFEARAFGPFLVLLTTEPTGDIDEYLRQTIRVQNLSWALGIGDSGINYQTAVTALRRSTSGS
jgi:Dolichyl-phosphate-mannose-protein mannosyltransferase